MLNLLQSGLPTPWLAEFQKFLTDLDTKTKVIWRAKLLEFVLETRNIIKLSKEVAKETTKEKEETVKNLILQLQDRFFPSEGGVAVTNTDLRTKLVSQLEQFRELQGKGAQGTRKGEYQTSHDNQSLQLCLQCWKAMSQ